MTFKIYVTENGHVSEVKLEYHLNHTIEDIDPRIQAAVALLDASSTEDNPNATVYSNRIQNVNIKGVGMKIFRNDAFSPPEYYISQRFIDDRY